MKTSYSLLAGAVVAALVAFSPASFAQTMEPPGFVGSNDAFGTTPGFGSHPGYGTGGYPGFGSNPGFNGYPGFSASPGIPGAPIYNEDPFASPPLGVIGAPEPMPSTITPNPPIAPLPSLGTVAPPVPPIYP